MRLSVLLCVLLCASACETMKAPTAPSKGPWRFSGTISAMNGTRLGPPIVGAELTVITGVNTNARVTSDGVGHFVFAELETDIFTVAIDAPGYVSAAPTIDLYGHIDANFALKPR